MVAIGVYRLLWWEAVKSTSVYCPAPGARPLRYFQNHRLDLTELTSK